MGNSKDRSARRVRRDDPASARPAASAFNVEAKQFGWAIAIAIVATALAVRLVHIWQLRASPFFSVLMGDSHGYDEWARRLAGGEWIGHEVFYQAPLYPYLLGVIYAIAGRHLLLVRIVQAIIGSASCALLGLAAARLFSRRAGIAAGLMLALYAPAIFFDGLLQKSVIDVFFLCLVLWLLTKTGTAEHAERAERSTSPRSLRLNVWVCLGLVIGGLALTRENALVFVVVILAWALIGSSESQIASESRIPNPESRVGAEPRIPNPESRMKRAAVFVAGLAIVLLPVAARNARVGGGFYITTSQFGPNFYIGNNPQSDGTYQSLRFGRGAPEYERQDATELAEQALQRKLSPSEVSSYWTDRALDFIASRPGAWLRLTARKFVLLWNATEMLDTESQEAYAEWSLPLRAGGFIGHFGILVPLALLGVIVTWPIRSRLWIFYAMTLAYAASVILFYVFARYRYPLVPLLILFAAAGVVELPAEVSDVVAKRPRRLKPWSLAAVAAAAVLANWPMLSTTLMRAVTENNLAVSLQSEGRLDEATDHYQRAIALQPDYAPAYNNLATAMRARGRLSDAVAAYERAIGLRPEYPEAHYNLANALTDAGKPREAVEHFRIALQAIPGSADVHNNLGIALMEEGRHDAAIAEFRAAVKADPQSSKAHRNLADALASTRRYDEALDEFHRAVRLDPADGSLHYDLGSLLLELDRLEEAIAEFRSALNVKPDSAEAHNNLGIALGKQGRLDEAIDAFRRALQVQPGFEDAQRNLAIALAAAKRER
jgi:tetratricopeptide (TPR) repeat protein